MRRIEDDFRVMYLITHTDTPTQCAISQNKEKASKEQAAILAARREREAMLAKAAPAPTNGNDAESRLRYLMAQSEVFAHFLAGSSLSADAAKAKKKVRAGVGRDV